jgi:opacity protein-like surface antigen
MSKRVTIAKAGLIAAAGLMALSTTAAQAQPYGYNGMGSGGYAYDPCKREKTTRGTVGALIGGTIGAVIGSNAAARNARTEGSLLGGALGAAVGAGVGNSSAACTSGQYVPPPPPPPPVETSYYGPRGPQHDRDDYAPARDDYAYDRRGDRYRVTGDAPEADGCTLAESPIYMPDGRTQTRFVRVCRDSSGRYAVVD